MTECEKTAKSLLSLLPYMHEKFLNPMERLNMHQMSKLHFFAIMLLYRKGPQTMSQLAQIMQVSKQQLTPLVNRILEQRQAERLTDPQDRRLVRIALTDSGKDFIEETMKKNLSALSQRLQVLPEEDLNELGTKMLRIRELLEKAEHLASEQQSDR